jgi:hypothetical protein
MELQASGAISATERCTICERRPAATLLHAATPVLHLGADEFLETPLSRHAWMVCTQCAGAVQQEMVRAGLRSPLRLYIAIAIVASERSPAAHPRVWNARYGQDADARTHDRWMMRLIMFLVACSIVAAGSVIAFVGLAILPVLVR